MAKPPNKTNSKQQSRLKEIGDKLVAEEILCFKNISGKMKFNFHFFDKSQFFMKSFLDLNAQEFLRLGDQLVELSEKSIVEWSYERMASRNSARYRNYGDFPKKSEYRHPKNVPEHAEWVAFRLGSLLRICGFIIPSKYHGSVLPDENWSLCSNTFYVVFYDHDHGFYKTKKR